ncbi:MAG: hypothetical protein AAFR45_01950 [Pseudomonadota bacterium]
MKKRLFLHIGHFKTGTTAIQATLANNEAMLRRLGLDYADEMRFHSKHSKLAFSVYRKAGVTTLMHGYRHDQAPEKVWSHLFDYVRNSACPNVLVSTEELIRVGAHPAAEAILRDIVRDAPSDIEFKIIAYLRAPNDHLRSWYNQLVKMNAMPVPDFNQTVTTVMEPVHVDYSLALKPWISIFGAENLHVRAYTADLKASGGLVNDLLSTVGIAYSAKLQEPFTDVNPRLDESLLELTRMLQIAGYSKDEVAWGQHVLGSFRSDQYEDDAQTVQAFEEIIGQSRSGLRSLRKLPHSNVDFEAFRLSPPRPEDPLVADTLALVGYLMSDVRRLRQNLYGRNSELRQRIDSLEERLKELEDPRLAKPRNRRSGAKNKPKTA